MDFWSLLNKAATLLQVLAPIHFIIVALIAWYNRYVESKSPATLSLILETKLSDAERLFEDLMMKDRVVSVVIDIQNPTFFKVFKQELER